MRRRARREAVARVCRRVLELAPEHALDLGDPRSAHRASASRQRRRTRAPSAAPRGARRCPARTSGSAGRRTRRCAPPASGRHPRDVRVGITRSYCSRATASSSASRSEKCWNTERSDTPARSAISRRGGPHLALVEQRQQRLDQRLAGALRADRAPVSMLWLRLHGPKDRPPHIFFRNMRDELRRPLDAREADGLLHSRDADGTQRAKPRGCKARRAGLRASAQKARTSSVKFASHSLRPGLPGRFVFLGRSCRERQRAAALRQLALGPLAVAAHLPHVDPRRAPVRDPGGSSKPPTSLWGTSDPGAVLLDEVAAHLEVALPLEVGRVVVRRNAGRARHATGTPTGAPPSRTRRRVAVQLDGQPHGEGEAVGRDQRQRLPPDSARPARPSARPTPAPRPRRRRSSAGGSSSCPERTSSRWAS